jgi:uncharacterized membrane protein
MHKKTNTILVIAAILVVVSLTLQVLGRLVFNWYPTDYYPHMFSGGMMPFGMIGMIGFWLLVIYGVTRLMDNRHACYQTSSSQLLKDRLSKGEITIEEYESISKKIKGDQ